MKNMKFCKHLFVFDLKDFNLDYIRNFRNPLKGPNPKTVQCDDAAINAFCTNFQSQSWLNSCSDKVDEETKGDLKKACVIDLCANNIESTRKDIVKTYVDICRQDQDDTFMCDWETSFSGSTPTCGQNMQYLGKIRNSRRFNFLTKIEFFVIYSVNF